MPYPVFYNDFYGDVVIIGSGDMAEAILFPDIIRLSIEYLTEQFDDIGETATVHSRVPRDRPVPSAKFVTVQRTGGTRRTIVSDNAQLTFEAWATTDEDAHDLAQLARALMHAMGGTIQDTTPIYGTEEFSGPAFLPDPLSAHSRYTFTLRVGTRGIALVPSGS